MPNYLIYIITTIIITLILVLFTKFKKDFIKQMSTLLYSEGKVDEYIERINSTIGKIFLNKKVRLFRLIDAYVMNDDKDNAIKIFDELESMKLTFGQEVNLYEKEVTFYVGNKMNEKAKAANDKIQELNGMVEIDDLNKIAINCNSLIDIYINKDGSLAQEMVDIADAAKNDSIKGTYYYRAAKCYYYKKDKKMVEKYLDKALKCLYHTSLRTEIEEAIKDNDKLA